MKKVKLRKIIASSLIVASVIALNPIGASAEWKQDSTGWWYTEGNSWATGWRQIDGKWYYFDSKGYMLHNTIKDGYYLNSSGAWTNDVLASQKIIGEWRNGVTECMAFGRAYGEYYLPITVNSFLGSPYKIISDSENSVTIIYNDNQYTITINGENNITMSFDNGPKNDTLSGFLTDAGIGTQTFERR